MTTTKVKCMCEHMYQDKKYGKGIRLANKCGTTNMGNIKYRCTVCGKEHSR